MSNDRTVTLRLPNELVETMQAQAEYEGRTLSDMIRRCCVLGLSRSHSLAKVRKGPPRQYAVEYQERRNLEAAKADSMARRHGRPKA